MCGGLFVCNLSFVTESKISNEFDTSLILFVIRGTLLSVYSDESMFPYDVIMQRIRLKVRICGKHGGL